jgi:hypothetical protein
MPKLPEPEPGPEGAPVVNDELAPLAPAPAPAPEVAAPLAPKGPSAAKECSVKLRARVERMRGRERNEFQSKLLRLEEQLRGGGNEQLLLGQCNRLLEKAR